MCLGVSGVLFLSGRVSRVFACHTYMSVSQLWHPESEKMGERIAKTSFHTPMAVCQRRLVDGGADHSLKVREFIHAYMPAVT
jgi:hypothetical protein